MRGTSTSRGRSSTARRLLATAIAGLSLTSGTLVLAGTGEVSFTPTGFKISVMRISLSTTVDGGGIANEQVLYTCPHATEAECLVDVTDQAALDAIAVGAGDAKVAVGTYDTISMSLCAEGKGGADRAPGFVRGIFTVPSEGRTFATDPDPASVTGLREVVAGASDAGADDASSVDGEGGDGGAGVVDAAAGAAASTPGGEFTVIGNWSCNTKQVVLQHPIEVKDGSSTPLTVVVDTKLLATSTPHVSPGMGGCRGNVNGQGRGFCVNYPSIFSLVGDQNPTIDRFLVAHHRTDPAAIDDAKANAYVAVARSGIDGTPLTAFVRPYFSETSAPTSANTTVMDPVYGGPFYLGETVTSSFAVVDGGGVSFVTGGTLDEGAIFHDFRLMEHRGQVDTSGDGAWQYHAIPLVDAGAPDDASP